MNLINSGPTFYRFMPVCINSGLDRSAIQLNGTGFNFSFALARWVSPGKSQLNLCSEVTFPAIFMLRSNHFLAPLDITHIQHHMQVLFSTACVMVLAAKPWTWVAKLLWDWQGLWISLLACKFSSGCEEKKLRQSHQMLHATESCQLQRLCSVASIWFTAL